MQRHISLLAALGLIGGMGAMTSPAALAAGAAGATAPAPMAATPAPMGAATPAPSGTNTPAAGTTAQTAPMPAPTVTKSASTEAPRAEPEWNHQTAVLQEALDSAGEHVAVDGVWGPRTTAAIRDYQRSHGLTVTGQLDTPTRKLLDPIG